MHPLHPPPRSARFSKAPETFRARKAILVICILKAEKCIGLKLCVKRTSVHIKNIMELNSSVVVRFEILMWLSGCEIFSESSRNGAQGTLMSKDVTWWGEEILLITVNMLP